MPPLERVGCRTLPNLFFRIVLFRRRQPRWRLGLNSIEGLLTPQGALGRRAIHAESPFFLILPSRRATKKVADHSPQPLEWSASQTGRGRHCREGADYRDKVARIFSKSIGGWGVGLQPT